MSTAHEFTSAQSMKELTMTSMRAARFNGANDVETTDISAPDLHHNDPAVKILVHP